MSNQMSYSAALSGTNTAANMQAGNNRQAGQARTQSPKPTRAPPQSPQEQARWNHEQAEERRARRQAQTTEQISEYAKYESKGFRKPQSHEEATRPKQPATRLPSPPRSQRPQDSENTSPRGQHTGQPSLGTSRTNTESGGYTAAEYKRREEHKPKTAGGQEEDVYILSLKLTENIHRFLTVLRETHFPVHLNKISGHIALFRALPGSQLPLIKQTVREVCAHTAPFNLEPSDATRMRKGVLVNFGVGTDEANELHRQLLDAWKGGDWLSVQDIGGFKAHVTVMNKVDDEDAVKRALQDVQIELHKFEPHKGRRDQAWGIGLHRYDRGWWRFEENFEFRGKEEHAQYKLQNKG